MEKPAASRWLTTGAILVAAVLLTGLLWLTGEPVVAPTMAPVVIPPASPVPSQDAPSASIAPSTTPDPTVAPTKAPKPPETGQPVAVAGIASWYHWRPGEAAAGPKLRAFLGPKWRGSVVTVCAVECVTVRLTDWCQCYKGTSDERLIDLDVDSFTVIAKPARGLVGVTVVR